MAFNLNIKNIGKLDDAKIRIGQFTVLAGPNNTGKSFVSKLLYSLFDAVNGNSAEAWIDNLTKPIRAELEDLITQVERDYRKKPSKNPSWSLLFNKLEELKTFIEGITIDDFAQLDKIIPNRIIRVSAVQKEISFTIKYLKDMNADSTKGNFPVYIDSDMDMNREKSFSKLHKVFHNLDAVKSIASGIEHKIRDNLIQNFQVPTLSNLTSKGDTPSEIDIKNVGKFKFSNENFEFNIDCAVLRKLKLYSNMIYLESPIYWKLKNALEGIRMHPRYSHSHRAQLSGVPGYFYDLASAIKYQYTGDMDFSDLYERLISKEVLGGKIALSESGDLSFQENGNSFSLPVTATGVTNLGMLALLIERKVLDKDSFIFIDEPEAHLHPAWQVVMAETLFKLAKGGVNVVIATHSADILKWLEVHVKKNPNDEDMVALNKFPINSDENPDQDFSDKIAAIKEELTKPFADLYLEGLL